MKRLLTILFAVISLQLAAQTQTSLPSGSVPFGSVYLAPDSSVWAGATGKTFKKIGVKADITRLDDSISALRTSIIGKVDKITGKGLSTEDYTTAEKSKLAGIEAGAEVNVNADWTAVSGDAMILNKPTFVATESDPVFLGQKGAVNGVATLNSSGKIPNAQIPALALVDTYVAASQAAMLALSSAEQGDVAIRTDLSKTFILTDNNYSTLASWKELLSPVIPAETDPIWGASPSAGITSTNIANWNTAYTYSQVGHLPLSGGTLSGTLNGTSSTFNSTIRAQNFNVFESSASRGGLYTYNIISGAGTDYSVGLFSEVEAWIAPNGATTRTARFTSSLTQFSTNTTILGHTTIGAAGGVRSLSIPGANSGGIYLYGAYSGSPASPGIDIYNQLGILTFSHNSNGGSTNIAGNLNLTKSSPLLVLNDTGGLAAQIGSFSNQLNFVDNATGTKGFNINLSSGAPTFTYFAGSGDRILFTNSSGGVSAGSIGSGLSWDAVNKVLSATGGATGTVTGTGTAGYIGKWTSASNMSNSIMSESSSTIFVAGAINATAHYIIAGASPRGGIYTYSGISGSGSDYSLGLYSEGDLYLAASGTASKLLTLNTTSATFIVPITATSFSGAATGLTGTASGLNIGGNAATATNSTQWGGNTYAGADGSVSSYLMAYKGSNNWGPASVSYVQSFLGLGSAAYTASSAYYSSTNPSGYISGINSSMVTTALGYTPANSTYTISGIGTPTISGITNVSFTTNYDNHYIRVGNEVTVRGKFLLQPVGTGLTVVRVSFPTSPDPTRGTDSAVGSASGIGIANGQINMHVGTTSAEITMNATTPIGNEVYYEFTYTAL